MVHLIHFAAIILLIPVWYTYAIYPTIVILFALQKKGNTKTYTKEQQPSVSILMAAHNEGLIVKDKIESILASDCNKEHIELIVGTDSCSDETDSIVAEYSKKYENIKHVVFTNRQGKVRIINELAKKAKNDILILTDANVLFSESTIFELTKHFCNEAVGLVDSHMKNYGMSPTGISFPEQSYISLEVKLKEAEGKLWGTMMGPFGGCFAIRKELFKPVPETYLVDDFHINMNVLKYGASSIHAGDAVVFEDVSNHLSAEFNRKVRISTGNFQNLAYFLKILLKPGKISFSFLSHKVLRWLSPFFIIGALASGILNFSSATIDLNFVIIAASLIVASLVMLDLIFMRVGVHIKLLRYLTHFTTMNAALLIGFFKYLKGNSNGIWNRTERLQNGSSEQ